MTAVEVTPANAGDAASAPDLLATELETEDPPADGPLTVYGDAASASLGDSHSRQASSNSASRSRLIPARPFTPHS